MGTIDLPGVTIKFSARNEYKYRQDFCFYQGIPCGINFDFVIDEKSVKLTADGYGNLRGGKYGNGSLYTQDKRVILRAKKILANAIQIGD